VRSELAKGHEGIVSKDGRFKCRATFQLETLDHVFGIGDTIDLSGLGLTRTAAAATFQLPTLVGNILRVVEGKDQSLSDYKPGAEPIFITVGPSGGAATVFGFYLPSFLTKRACCNDGIR